MSPFVPLLAQGAGDLIWIVILVVFCIFFFLSAIGQWIAKLGQQQRPGGGPGGGPPARRAPGGALEDEIGDFLRRAARRRQGQPPPPPPPGRPVIAEAVDVEVVPEGPLGAQMKKDVAEYLNTGKFQRRAAQLGDEVAQADEHLGERLHQAFDHEVGRLAGTPGESAGVPQVEEAEEPEDRVADIPSTAAAGLAAMLGSGESIRQAIVITEILQRPEHRWA